MRARSLPSAQRGMILLVTLLTMVILLVSSIAMLRSFDTSMLLSGSMAFKRDLLNQGERGIAQAIALLNSGALSTESARETTHGAVNYSASSLPTNAHGIPEILLSDRTFAREGMSGADIVEQGVSIRTVIDRQCRSGSTRFNTEDCVHVPGYADSGGTNWLKKAGSGYLPIYRISVRVSGPRNTQVFLQTTLSH